MANDPRNNFPVTIGARNYVSELSEAQWRPIAAIRQARDESTEPGEGSLNQYGIWKRTRENFILGAGQEWVDDNESDPLRFNSSRGLDPWDVRKIKMLNDTEQKRSTAQTSAKLVAVDDYIYWLDGGTLRYEATPTGATGWGSSVTGSGYTDITQFGDRLFACDGSNIYLVDNTGRTSYSTYNADMVLYANGRLVAADANALVEIDSVGASSAIWTHPNANFVWRGGTSAPNGIYVFGDSGGTSEIYFIGIIDATTTLAAPYTAAPLTPNETVNALYHYGGVILIASTSGLRLATITGIGHLSYGTALGAAGEVKDVVGDGEDVWFTWTNYQDTENPNNFTGLGRARLNRFTETLVPRYATDLMAGTDAAAVQGTCLAVCSYGGARYFVISGNGLYGETTDTKVATARYNSGWVTYGTPELKNLMSLDLHSDTIPSGASIAATLIEDDGTETASTTLSTGVGNIADITGVSTEAVQIELLFTRATDVSADVALKRWTLRSIPMPYRSSQVVLPVQLRSSVANRRSTRGLDVKSEWDYLRTLESSRALITVTIGDFSFTAYVDGVGFEQGGIEDWDGRQTFLEGVVYVHLVTVEATS